MNEYLAICENSRTFAFSSEIFNDMLRDILRHAQRYLTTRSQIADDTLRNNKWQALRYY